MKKTTSLSDAFLSQMIAELDNESVRAIILRGSYARGDAIPHYSDVDFTLIIHEAAGHNLPKCFFWRQGYLVSVSTHSYAAYRERLTKPEQAIFAVTGVREAQILLDKDGEFHHFQKEVAHFQWTPLQDDANAYAGQKLMLLSEIILRTLKVLVFSDDTLLAKMLLDILMDSTEAIAVQRGILVVGQNYWQAVQESIGYNSAWTYYQKIASGNSATASPTLRERAIAALHFYQETCRLLQTHLLSEHMEVIEPLLKLIEQTLADKEIS